MKLFCKKSYEYEILDIGGSVGSSILSFRKMDFQNKILVFESNTDLVDNYLNKIKLKDPGVEVYNYALGNTNKIQDFFLPIFNKTPLHMFMSYKESFVR